GEIEAARAVGMGRMLMFRRILAPQILRSAIPGLGNVWQLALKESALISVVGLTELLRQAQVGAGSTRQPFVFFITAALLYLLLSTVS
ncbi:ABC transporter permease subunit, partial [Acinetobacter baumannii]